MNNLNIPDEATLAWMAGFFDGEGNIHISGQYKLSVTIVNTDLEVLQIFHAAFGGVVQQHSAATSTRKRSYHWRIGGNVIVKTFIELLLPHTRLSKNLARFNFILQFIDFDRGQPPMRIHRDLDRYEWYYHEFRNRTYGKHRAD